MTALFGTPNRLLQKTLYLQNYRFCASEELYPSALPGETFNIVMKLLAYIIIYRVSKTLFCRNNLSVKARGVIRKPFESAKHPKYGMNILEEDTE
ncbi:uncharacterized protein H6S33_006450 [Morchella sextelata]|uniref:uncharacterized protein n=1 Tax=Morchella sextelata TaxID=1174677 RepID=UPI001D036DBC|nr:uncharacterized protein H6S33_006450 [Morchella sextelata]KAH0604782.1 hypothetical protein H6S33_006450 [Morchella sextelata]